MSAISRFLLPGYVIICGLFCSGLLIAADEAPAAVETVSYHTQIKPIFQAHCQGCHQPAKPQGDYVMTSFAELLKGGESETAAVIAGDPAGSYLIEQITPDENGSAQMPKGKAPLSNEQITLISRWVEQGAHDDTPESANIVYDAQHPPVYITPPVIGSLDFSPDGQFLAVNGHHEVLIHKADGTEIVSRLVGVSDRVESVAFSPDGSKLAVTGGAPARMGELQVWDIKAGELQLSLPVTYDTIYGASWSPDGTKIAFGCADNSLRVVDAVTGEQVLFMGSHNDWVLDTTFSVDGSFLATVGRDQTAKLTEFETQRFVDNITSITPGALTGGLAAIARHPARDEILVGGADGIPRTYRMERLTKRVIGDDANLVRQLPPLKGRIFSVAFRPDGQQITAVSSLDGKGFISFYSYDVDGALPDELKKILEKRVAERSAEEKQKVIDYNGENVSQTATAELVSPAYSVAYHPNGQQVAVGCGDGKIRLFDSITGFLQQEFSAVPLTSAAVQRAEQEKTDWKFGSTEIPTQQSSPDGITIAELRVEPAQLELFDPFAYSQLIVMARLAGGDEIDVTRLANIQSPEQLVRVDALGLLQPVQNGTGQLLISFSGQQVTVPVTVSGQETVPATDYVQLVTPVLSKLGCNQGTCHGSAQGKAGFKLSLRGYDPIFDVRALTDDHASRRSNPAAPEESLMLLKAIGGVPHVGGQLTTADHKYYQVLKSWIEQGTKLDLASPRVAAIDIFPKNPVIQRIGSQQQVRVIATYTNGMVRDVTYEAFVESGNTEVATINSSGLLTAIRRGEAPILARYEGAYSATTLTAMGDREGFVWQQPETYGTIDELVAAKWERMKILPADICTDAEFIRRVTLDLTGLPPTVDAVKSFLADEKPSREKRNAYIDYLIGSDPYVEHMTNKWADMLLVNGKFLGREGADLFRNWIRQQVSENKPYDEFVYNILTATGSNKANPPASYFKVLRTAEDTMENTTHLFLGVRFNCNKCHDHPFERWTQDQYYETAAFFSQIDLQRAPESNGANIGGSAVESGKPLYEMVVDKKEGEITHQRTGEIAPPVFPYDADIATAADAPRRQQLAAWMTSAENDYFARSYVNRLWGYLLGTGIIEPIDDIRAGNPPTNPELLNFLTQEFIANDFDTQHIIRLITQSRTYQLSLVTNPWNEDDQINFSHAKARRLSAEALYDAVHLVTGAQSQIPGVPAGTRAAALSDSQIKLPDGFLNNFGRPTRESSCECERTNEVQLGPVMALVSGPTVATAIADPKNSLPILVQEFPDNEQLINELFLKILNRPASTQEINTALTAFDVIDPSHEQLSQQLADKEAWWVPLRQQKEIERQVAIASATKILSAYQAEIASRVAEQEQQRLDKIAAAEKAIADYLVTIDQEPFQKWLAEQRETQATWHYLQAENLIATNQAEIRQLADGSILAKAGQGNGDYEFSARTSLQNIRSIRIEALTDDSLPGKGPGLGGGNFVLTEFVVTAAVNANTDQFRPVKLTNAQADFSQGSYDVSTAIDKKLAPAGNGWAVSPQIGKEHWATFELAAPLPNEQGMNFKFTMRHRYQDGKHLLGRFRISLTSAENADPTGSGQLARQLELVNIPDDQITPAERKELLEIFQAGDKNFTQLRAELDKANEPVPIDPKVLVLQKELKLAEMPVQDDPALVQLRLDMNMSEQLLANKRLTAAQDVAWALINSPAFLFNH